MTAGAAGPGFWSTLLLLLVAAFRRSRGRSRHRRKLIRAQYGRSVRDWGWTGFAIAIVVMSFSNIAAAFLARGAVRVGEHIAIERQGQIQVEPWFARTVQYVEAQRRQPDADAQRLELALESAYAAQAQSIVAEFGGNPAATVEQLRAAFRTQGAGGFVERSTGGPFSALSRRGVWPAMAGSLALFVWSMLLVFQVEGFEFSPQQRSQPMWEWLFSHPAPPSAIFLAEMLSPLVATPIYYSAPLFPGLLYGFTYGAGHGVLAALVVGLPIALAAGCLGKAIEITSMLLLAPRTRGTVFGVMGWVSFVASMLIIFGAVSIRELKPFLLWLEPLTALPWPFIGQFLGQQSDGSFSFVGGMLACWTGVAATITASVAVAVFAARHGLSGNVNVGDLAPKKVAASFGGFFAGADPFYRKELLWLARDRSAIVMAVMIPLTIGALQLFSTRGLYSIAVSDWNFICAAAIIVGTYFLLILGPRALGAEGEALWTVLTWPRGLEELFKAKAKLWTWLATALASPLFFYAAWRFPANIWQVALVGLGWWVFARSLAEKSATLLVVTTGSGEMRGVSWGRRMAVSLGVMTFATGVMTRQWAIAVAGIVYSIITAAAMWQHFRARLPYLFDPWSEKPTAAPTTMQAMIAISALAEGATLLAGTFVIGLGVEQFAIARAVSFCTFAVIVSLIVAKFLRNRGVSFADIWLWRNADGRQANWQLAPSLLAGAVLGAVLGVLALGYLALLHMLPMTAEFMDQMAARRDALPNLHLAYFVMAVLFAPAAEEYLFRGMLYRTLDREWGGWLAILASAVFFMIYHPFVSWLPVGAVGIAAALVFRRTGHLAAAVALHTVYNAIVVAI